jgi:thiol-disulfide isomerase/thioredoxin
MLLEFYGTECPHCVRMAPVVDKLEKEEGVTIEKYETWHNEENAENMNTYDTGLCGGVPFFFNTETKAFICGETSYEALKKWAGR